MQPKKENASEAQHVMTVKLTDNSNNSNTDKLSRELKHMYALCSNFQSDTYRSTFSPTFFFFLLLYFFPLLFLCFQTELKYFVMFTYFVCIEFDIRCIYFQFLKFNLCHCQNFPPPKEKVIILIKFDVLFNRFVSRDPN